MNPESTHVRRRVTSPSDPAEPELSTSTGSISASRRAETGSVVFDNTAGGEEDRSCRATSVTEGKENRGAGSAYMADAREKVLLKGAIYGDDADRPSAPATSQRRPSFWPKALLVSALLAVGIYSSYPNMKASSLFSVLTTGAALTNAIPVKQDPSIGKLPPMGFNSWNAFKCDIDETKFLVAAQKMIELGLKDAGYEYVNIDDCWAVKSGRDPVTGRILPDTTKFPEGIKGTADKIHAMGLKIGIYSDAGVETCAGYPGSLYYEHVDAQTFEEWGIDFLKYDNCAVPSNWTDEYIWYPENWYGTHEDQPTGSAPLDYDFSKTNQTERYARMKRALDAIERPIFYSLCNWGHQHVERWGKDMGQTWRMWGDIYPEWDGRYDYSWGVTPILNHASFFAEYSDFYGHNDFDMLEVGNGNLTLAEMRSHFALWAALKSPLLIGTPLDKITPETAAILLNKELISFNQDPNYGKSALPFKWGINPDWTWNRTHPAEYWSGQSSRGIHVFILNSLSSTETKSLSFKDVPGLNGKEKYEVWDMWTSKRIGTFKGKLEIKIEGHDTAALRITKVGGKHPHKGKLPLPKIWKDKPLRSVWPLPKGWKGRA